MELGLVWVSGSLEAAGNTTEPSVSWSQVYCCRYPEVTLYLVPESQAPLRQTVYSSGKRVLEDTPSKEEPMTMQPLEVYKEDLEWTIHNEQHWFSSTCGEGEHLIIVHNAYGPIFPWHFAGTEEMYMESKFLPSEHWGCHYFARWWKGETDFWSCDVFTDESGLTHMTFHTKRRERVVELTAMPVAAFFLTRLIRVRTPLLSVRWMGTGRRG